MSGVTVDVCQSGCGGVWCDRFELDKLVDLGADSEIDALAAERDPARSTDRGERPCCPRCGVPMMRRLFSPQRRVEVEECPACAGFWLDSGELEQIRAPLKHLVAREPDEERRKETVAAAARTFDDQFAPLLSKALPESVEETEPRLVERLLGRVFPSLKPGTKRLIAFFWPTTTFMLQVFFLLLKFALFLIVVLYATGACPSPSSRQHDDRIGISLGRGIL